MWRYGSCNKWAEWKSRLRLLCKAACDIDDLWDLLLNHYLCCFSRAYPIPIPIPIIESIRKINYTPEQKNVFSFLWNIRKIYFPDEGCELKLTISGVYRWELSTIESLWKKSQTVLYLGSFILLSKSNFIVLESSYNFISSVTNNGLLEQQWGPNG